MLEFVERTSQEIFRKLGDVEGNQGKKCREEVDRREKEGCNEIQRMEWRRGVDTREENCQDETVIKCSTEYRSLHETV